VSTPSVLGGARLSFGVRAWHWQVSSVPGGAQRKSFGGGAAHWQTIKHGPAGTLYCGPPPQCLIL